MSRVSQRHLQRYWKEWNGIKWREPREAEEGEPVAGLRPSVGCSGRASGGAGEARPSAEHSELNSGSSPGRSCRG